ncbi:hypothetical protein PN36_09615 [Candidatus Thiomargarita nelsonii]|uniref:CobQ/CobB/MinD/ParA nucleotide binding domain-containing protein n=1 Tax=Candidatus Thiomargarita nelsonii TaxID=1003181 RepID=A0A0A6P1G3_9GAMM|nr:hypothetical protein PN36_09615 [Candidatus Thiomargarita nelsonii]
MEWHIVTGSKGGVGKTLLTLMILARNLERGESSALALDFNAMNADTSAILLDSRRRERTIIIEHDAGTELFGADKIVIQKTFTSLRRTLRTEKKNYAIGWPSNQFSLYPPTLFADMLGTIKDSTKDIENQLNLPKLGSVIIDTNYHFCNIFSNDEKYYKSYQKMLDDGDTITVWFMWVYRQLENLLKPGYEADAKIVSTTAAAIEEHFMQNNTAPLMHVFSPVALISSELEKTQDTSPIFKFLNAIKKDDKNISIDELEQIAKLPKGDYIYFQDWVDELDFARNNLLSGNNDDIHSLFLDMLINAIPQGSEKELTRPRNVMPLAYYHADLQYYTDRVNADPVSNMKKFDIYKNFLNLLG